MVWKMSFTISCIEILNQPPWNKYNNNFIKSKEHDKMYKN